MAPIPELCTAEQVAELYSVSAESVRRWARDGKLASITLPSGRKRFKRADVEALITGEPAAQVPA